jgi:hypothetical protein
MTLMNDERPASPAFAPEELSALCDAFEAAWAFVQRSHGPNYPDLSGVRDSLARDIIIGARSGETNTVALANVAIRRVRAKLQPALPGGTVPAGPSPLHGNAGA